MWIDNGNNWSEMPAPEGRLSDALVAEDQIYLVIDGDLWRHPIDALN